MTEHNVLHGDCREIMRLLLDEGLGVHSIVTDPPYGLNFMSRYWDAADNVAFQSEVWRLCLDLLSPGGHLVAFGGTRTYHRLCSAIEDAGFEIRDQLAWVYGQGLPHGMNVSKAIDKTMGPATPEALQWQGWATQLKPAWEPIVLARKPLSGTIVENVLTHTTGALNVDACRIPIDADIDDPRLGGKGSWSTASMAKNAYGVFEGTTVGSSPKGRFPANLTHDASPEVTEAFAVFGTRGGGDRRGDCNGKRPAGFGDVGHSKGDSRPNATVYADSGTAARFFYGAKANKTERAGSSHPTIKPVRLMQWLVRLVTPPGGIVLDPFAGTGTTGEAARLEGFDFILIEQDANYIRDIERRLTE